MGWPQRVQTRGSTWYTLAISLAQLGGQRRLGGGWSAVVEVASYKVGEIARDGRPGYLEVATAPRPGELDEAHAAALRAGLRRFDTRRRPDGT